MYLYSIDEGCLDENDNETNLTGICVPQRRPFLCSVGDCCEDVPHTCDMANNHSHDLLKEHELDALNRARMGVRMRKDQLRLIEGKCVQGEKTSFFVLA